MELGLQPEVVEPDQWPVAEVDYLKDEESGKSKGKHTLNEYPRGIPKNGYH